MSGQLIDHRLGHIAEDGQATAHISVQCAVTHGQLTLVPRGQQKPTELVRQGHEDVAADAGLDVLFRDSGGGIGEVWAHDDDITIWGPGERDRIQGWDGPNGVKAWYEAAMGGMAQCDFKIHDLLIKVSSDGTAAVVTYYVENDFVDKDGNKGKMTPRVTVVKELRDGVWKQIHGDASFSIAEIQATQ